LRSFGLVAGKEPVGSGDKHQREERSGNESIP
jgi:hypothetical protein